MKLSKPPGVAQTLDWAIALLTLGKRELDSPTVQQTIGCINLAPTALERLKAEKAEEFEKLKSDIPLILAEGKGAYLNLDKSWREIHFVLTGEDYSVHLPFLVGENDKEGVRSRDVSRQKSR